MRLKFGILLNVHQKPLVIAFRDLFGLRNELSRLSCRRNIIIFIDSRLSTSSNPVCVIMSSGAWKSSESVFSLSLVLRLPEEKALVIFLLFCVAGSRNEVHSYTKVSSIWRTEGYTHAPRYASVSTSFCLFTWSGKRTSSSSSYLA